MTVQPLLSICIPTYRREDFLFCALAELLPEAERLGVEVCVSDNCSPGAEKKKILGELSSKFGCLRVQFQSSNIGLDRNMLAAIQMASGEYVFPLGDDDYLPAAALGGIIDRLSGSSADLLVLDGWHTDAHLGKIRRHLPLPLRGRYYTSPVEAFADLWHLMPFGSFVCVRGAFEEQSWVRYLGTSHAYTGAVWDFVARKFQSGGCRIECDSLPTVCLRGAEKSWKSDFARIHFVEIPDWFNALPPAYRGVSQAVLGRYLRVQTRLRNLVQLRVLGQLAPDTVHDLSTHLTNVQRARVWLAAYCPVPVINVLNRARSGIGAMKSRLKQVRESNSH